MVQLLSTTPLMPHKFSIRVPSNNITFARYDFSSVTIQWKIQKPWEFIVISRCVFANHCKCWFLPETKTYLRPLNTNTNDGNQHFPIHLVCSGHPQTINGFKQWILTITGPNYELRFCGNSGAGAGRQVTRWNRLIDAIFPILRTFHP